MQGIDWLIFVAGALLSGVLAVATGFFGKLGGDLFVHIKDLMKPEPMLVDKTFDPSILNGAWVRESKIFDLKSKGYTNTQRREVIATGKPQMG